jgi:FKBP-type peptidyl-prolyl cis-trans isomerase
MKKNLMLLAVAAIALTSCGGGFKQGQGGMLYSIHEDKAGPTIKEGDFVAINLIAKTEGDSVLTNTYTTGRPIPAMMPKPQYKGDIYAGLMLLSEGDSATIKLNIDSMAKKGQPKPPGMKGKYILFQVKVEKVIAKGNLADNIFKGRIDEYFKGVTEQLKKAEPAKIQKYIADNNLKTTKTASGLNYEITKPGTGPTPTAGDTAVVYYTGKFLTGKVFETNVKDIAIKDKATYNPMNPYKAIRIPVGVKQVIPGWDEGLMLLNKGAKATLVVPAALAYGEQGMGPIQPFTTLVFDVEVVDIVKPNPNAPKPVAPPMPQVQAQQQPVKK